MVKVKICGITNIDDAVLAAELGAWAIGFIFYSKSPRYISPENAQKISQQVKKYGTKTVGVFVNESPEEITKIADFVNLDYVQLHGFESISDCKQLKVSYIKNIRNIAEINDYNDAFAFLIDAADTQNWGGTGDLADWDLAKEIKNKNCQDMHSKTDLNENLCKPLILSGGLSLDNIEKALTEVEPDYVDVSSSLEISPGVKNHELMREFFEKIKNFKETKINE